jgi:hypothetical protein
MAMVADESSTVPLREIMDEATVKLAGRVIFTMGGMVTVMSMLATAVFPAMSVAVMANDWAPSTGVTDVPKAPLI